MKKNIWGRLCSGERIRLDLNFERDWIELPKLDPVKKMAGRLVSMDEQSRACLYSHELYMDVKGLPIGK